MAKKKVKPSPVVIQPAIPPIVVVDPPLILTSKSRGTLSEIIPPINAVPINPGSNIQNLINANPPGTIFNFKRGIHSINSSNTPKSGNQFIGEFGSILDGSNWFSTDRDDGCFKALNQTIDGVIFRNLTIQKMPQRGITSYKDFSNRWTIDHCEIKNCHTGVILSNFNTISNSIIHDCIGNPFADNPSDRGGAYSCGKGIGILLENNEFYNNGPEQKLLEGGTLGHTVKNNYYHNTYVGIWFDGDNSNGIIEDNLIEDIIWQGIFYEISETGVIQKNIVRRAETGIFVSTSKNNLVHENTIEDCWRGITLFLNCDAIGDGIIKFDLANNLISNNIIKLGTKAYSYASSFSYAGSCPPSIVLPYVNGLKINQFEGNKYYVPYLNGSEWNWGDSNKSFSQWQSIGQDKLGTVSLI